MGKIRTKLVRLQELLKSYENLDNPYPGYKYPGDRASKNRMKVFTREKINGLLKELQNEISPKIFQIKTINTRGIVKYRILTVDDPEDIKLYFNFLSSLNHEIIELVECKEIPAESNKPLL